MQKSCIQLYTGDGKGKTTAAFGLALRAAGRGKRVYIIQFLKGSETGEVCLCSKISDAITVEQFGLAEFYFPKKSNVLQHRAAAAAGLARAYEILADASTDMLILDEIVGAVSLGLVTLDEIFLLIDAKCETVELVLTGRDAPDALIERCDLVTEMKEVKHYYQKGVAAREGIEY